MQIKLRFNTILSQRAIKIVNMMSPSGRNLIIWGIRTGNNLWYLWIHQNDAGVLLPTLDMTEVDVQLFHSYCHNVGRLQTQSGQWKPQMITCLTSDGELPLYLTLCLGHPCIGLAMKAFPMPISSTTWLASFIPSPQILCSTTYDELRLLYVNNHNVHVTS